MSVFKRKGVSSPNYHYDFWIEGRRFTGSTGCSNERDALTVEREKKEQARRLIALEQLDPARTTVEQVFARYWKTHGHKLSWAPTLKDHMLGLEAFLGPKKPFLDVTMSDLAAALDDYGQTEGRRNRGGTTTRPGRPSNSTINRRLAAFRGIYMKARDEWELPVSPIVFKKLMRKEPKERVRALTREEARRLISKLPKSVMLIVAWSIATGCRKKETRTLTWSRVNFETMQAEVLTKGGGTRFIELGNNAVAILAECDRNRSNVFDYRNLRRHFEAALAAAEITDFRFHDLRHTFATWLGNAIGDLAIVMKALGHSEIGTTMKYRHVVRSDVQRGVQQLPTLIEGKVALLTDPEMHGSSPQSHQKSRHGS